ncbi:hypothetical protein LSAT2_000268 [Lamellibrachia satsuma]|nr:hypothetical protein LSAT2_000268 [Lamellibrachia satsuma]
MKGPVETIESNEYVRTPSSGGGGEGGTRRNVDFSEFMWMADEELEDFDRRYYEELLIEECIKDCSDDADLSDSGVVCFVSPPTQPSQSSQQQWQQPSSQQPYSIADDMQSLNMNSNAENRSTSNRRSSRSREQGSLPAQVVSSSKLNPNAPVFVPRTACKTSETDEAGLR